MTLRSELATGGETLPAEGVAGFEAVGAVVADCASAGLLSVSGSEASTVDAGDALGVGVAGSVAGLVAPGAVAAVWSLGWQLPANRYPAFSASAGESNFTWFFSEMRV